MSSMGMYGLARGVVAPGAGWAIAERRWSLAVLAVWLGAVALLSLWSVSSMRLES